MYNKIYNPITNRYQNISTKKGVETLKNYINYLKNVQLGGASTDTSMSPAIEILNTNFNLSEPLIDKNKYLTGSVVSKLETIYINLQQLYNSATVTSNFVSGYNYFTIPLWDECLSQSQMSSRTIKGDCRLIKPPTGRAGRSSKQKEDVYCEYLSNYFQKIIHIDQNYKNLLVVDKIVDENMEETELSLTNIILTLYNNKFTNECGKKQSMTTELGNFDEWIENDFSGGDEQIQIPKYIIAKLMDISLFKDINAPGFVDNNN